MSGVLVRASVLLMLLDVHVCLHVCLHTIYAFIASLCIKIKLCLYMCVLVWMCHFASVCVVCVCDITHYYPYPAIALLQSVE